MKSLPSEGAQQKRPRKYKLCEMPGCTRSAEGSSRGTGLPGHCVSHGGGNRCEEPGCTTSAEGTSRSTGIHGRCVTHGGGNRCEEPRCTQSAQNSSRCTGLSGRCNAHGGGNRCEEPGCTTSATGSSRGTGLPGHCVAHGGGNRCEEPGCTTSAVGSSRGTGLPGCCKAHGGGNRCEEPRCTTSAAGSSRGTGLPGRCNAHGGGNRCEELCCSPFPVRTVAVNFHPETGIGMCTYACHNMVIEARIEDDDDEAERLKKYFGFKKSLLLRAEHVFYFELVKKVPRLTTLVRVLDQTVFAKLFNKTKDLKDPRPDYFHLNTTTNMALHGEFDETDDHEDKHDRLRKIAHHAGCGAHRVYYFRVNACIGTAKALLRRVKRKQGRYYSMTPLGRSVLDQVAAYVEECLDLMAANQPPPAAEGRTLEIRRF